MGKDKIMRSISKQLRDHEKIRNIIVPNYFSQYYYDYVQEYVRLCYLDAEFQRQRNDNIPYRQHSTSKFLIDGFLHNEKMQYHKAIKVGDTLQMKSITHQKDASYSRSENPFTFPNDEKGDPYRLERLFAVIEGNAAKAIKSKINNAPNNWNPYAFPKEVCEYNSSRPNSSSFLDSFAKIRVAISAFFAIHYLRSQLTKVFFEREYPRNFGHEDGFYSGITERKYFQGENYPDFIEFLLPLVTFNMSTRSFSWCNQSDYIILPEKNLITPIKVKEKDYLFLCEEGYYLPLAPKFSVYVHSLNSAMYNHDVIIDGDYTISTVSIIKSIELFSYEILLNQTGEAKFISHVDSNLEKEFSGIRDLSKKDKPIFEFFDSEPSLNYEKLFRRIPKPQRR